MSGRIGAALAAQARVVTNGLLSSAFRELVVDLGRPFDFLPGQFAMLNLPPPRTWTFSRPFSILAAAGNEVSFLYRVVGRGTAELAELDAGAPVQVLGPLGASFPAPEAGEHAVLLAGGVGLPPILAWRERWGRDGDIACFGARNGGEVPWERLGAGWHVSVDDAAGLPAGRSAFTGVVTDLARSLPGLPAAGTAVVHACGPLPLLRAAARLAAGCGWNCHVSLEEHMGCGYGVCKGCVVSVRDGASVRNATCCQEGPVFVASSLPSILPGTGDAAGEAP